MTQITRHSLVSDPVTAINQLIENIEVDTEIAEIRILESSLASALETCEQLETEKKKLSGKIGKQKRNGLNTDSLIDEMRGFSISHSAAKEQLDKILDSIEEYVSKTTQNPPGQKDKISILNLPAYFGSNVYSPGSEELKAKIELTDSSVEWNTYVSGHSRSTHYHNYEWRNIIESTFGHSSFYIVAKDDKDAVCGVLPLVHMNSTLFGNFLVSMPYFNYGGALADSELINNQLFQFAGKLCADTQCSHAEIRETSCRADVPAMTSKVSMVLELPETALELDRKLGSKIRAQASRSIREGATVVHGGIENIDAFYTVFSHKMRDLGTPVYSRSFFTKIAESFPESIQISVVKLNKLPVAAAFLISHGETIEVPWASSLNKANQLGVNMYLYRSILEEAITQRYKFFDFGRSTVDAPTFRFKQQWGANPQQLYWNYVLNTTPDVPRINPENPKYRIAIAIWKKMPVAMTNLLGPLIVKNIP